jgi:bleomycin hydrolase
LGAASSGALDESLIRRIEHSYTASAEDSAAINLLTANPIKNLAIDRNKLINRDKLVNFKLKDAGITNQQSSGRCWLFSALNTYSADVMTKLKLSSFQFSQPFLTFWDKMEKANLFLEQMIEMADAPLDDRRLVIILSDPFGDGGWYDYTVNLMEKYGAVPLSAMPETKQSINTGTINALANAKLRAFASELRNLNAKGKTVADLRARKEVMLADIYKLLVYTYGQPPSQFTFRYESKGEKDSVTTLVSKQYTPLAFYDEFVKGKQPDYAMLMSNPTKDFDRVYSVEFSRNVYDKPDVSMLNLPVARFKGYCLKALLDSQAVNFACDVDPDNLRDSAIMVRDIYRYSDLFGMSFDLTKAQRIELRQSTPNHSMVFVGVDTANGKPLKWLVENSWGATAGDKGYWYMDDDWFDEYVYVVVVDKKYLSKEDADLLMQKPVRLPMWDPFWSALRQ